MPKPSPSSSTRLATPHPVSPVAGRPAEGPAPTFSWTPVPNADAYRLQIASEADFADLYFDAPVENHTALTVYDALPADGSTCYWRVRAEDEGDAGPWSGVAHFTAAPDADVPASDVEAVDDTARVSVSSPRALPTPSSPIEDAPVDGQSAVFEWEPAAAAAGYQIQIARTTDFDDPVVDLTLDRTTSLTLYGMLPEDESTFHWRLRALLPGQRTSKWSRAASFTTATDLAVQRHRAAQEEAKQEAREQEQIEAPQTAVERAEAESPVLSARTSGGFSAVVAYIMVLSFLATLFLIARAV